MAAKLKTKRTSITTMGSKIQAFDIFQTPLSSHYPLPFNANWQAATCLSNYQSLYQRIRISFCICKCSPRFYSCLHSHCLDLSSPGEESLTPSSEEVTQSRPVPGQPKWILVLDIFYLNKSWSVFVMFLIYINVSLFKSAFIDSREICILFTIPV